MPIQTNAHINVLVINDYQHSRLYDAPMQLFKQLSSNACHAQRQYHELGSEMQTGGSDSTQYTEETPD